LATNLSFLFVQYQYLPFVPALLFRQPKGYDDLS